MQRRTFPFLPACCSAEALTGLVFLLLAGTMNTAVYAMPEEQVMVMLEAHNSVRERMGIDGLSWSDELADYAQEWADYLAESEHCAILHRKEIGKNNKPYGENIYWAGNIRWSDGRTEIQRIDPAYVADIWSGEAKYYDQATNSCAAGKTCGHYTQMIWRRTQKLGCGMRICADNGQVWVCNYSPPGNIVGESP